MKYQSRIRSHTLWRLHSTVCILLVSLFACNKILAQADMINGDFGTYYLHNDPGNVSCGSNNHVVFDHTSLPNWIPTHGTPNVTNGAHTHAGVNGDPANQVFMWGLHSDGGDAEGEGIAGYIQFFKGVTYTIHIGGYMQYGLAPVQSGNINLYFYAANGLVENYQTVGCDGPSQGITDKELIKKVTATGTFTFTQTITFTPTSNYSQIYIFPNADLEKAESDVYLDFVNISVCTSNFDQFFLSYNFPSPNPAMLVAGNHTKRHEFAGTGCFNMNAPGAPTSQTNPVEADPAQLTNLIGEDVQLVTDLIVQPNTEGAFLAAAVHACDGTDDPGNGSGGGGNQGKHGATEAPNYTQSVNNKNPDHDPAIGQNEQLSFLGLNIYPNPSDGIFTIKIPQQGIYEMQVLDVLGNVVYKDKLNGNAKHSIGLGGKVPPGNYTVQLTNENVRYVEKITIVK